MRGQGKGPIKDELLVLDEQLRRQMEVPGVARAGDSGHLIVLDLLRIMYKLLLPL